MRFRQLHGRFGIQFRRGKNNLSRRYFELRVSKRRIRWNNGESLAATAQLPSGRRLPAHQARSATETDDGNFESFLLAKTPLRGEIKRVCAGERHTAQANDELPTPRCRASRREMSRSDLSAACVHLSVQRPRS